MRLYRIISSLAVAAGIARPVTAQTLSPPLAQFIQQNASDHVVVRVFLRGVSGDRMIAQSVPVPGKKFPIVDLATNVMEFPTSGGAVPSVVHISMKSLEFAESVPGAGPPTDTTKASPSDTMKIYIATW